jgi:hypothetical protein
MARWASKWASKWASGCSRDDQCEWELRDDPLVFTFWKNAGPNNASSEWSWLVTLVSEEEEGRRRSEEADASCLQSAVLTELLEGQKTDYIKEYELRAKRWGSS